jgi:Flp pilus assembly protein TadG
MTRMREKSESGAALVEFALILPVFMILVLGVFSGAVVYNQKLDLAHAAREGARFGSVLKTPGSGGTFTGACSGKTWAQCVQGVAVERSGNDLTTTGTCVALVKDDLSVYTETGHPATDFSTESGGTTCPNANDAAGRGMHVQVTGQRTGKIEALVLKWNMTLKSNASAKYEG